MKRYLLIAFFFAAAACGAAELPVTIGRTRVRDAVERLREDAHADVSFIEGDQNATVVIDDANLSVDGVLREIARQLPSYRYEVIDGHPFLHDADARWQAKLDNIDFRNAARERAMLDYVALLRRRPEFAKLIPPGHIGRAGDNAPAENDPLFERVTLERSGTVVQHLAQLLGTSRRLVIDIQKFQWGTEIADGIKFTGIAPLAFDPPVAGEPAGTKRFKFDLGSYDLYVLLKNGFEKMGLEAYTKALAHPRPAVREAGIEKLNLTARSPAQFKAAVRKLLNDPSMAVRLRAAEALLDAGETTGYSVVASAARDAKDPNVRLAGIAGLAKFPAMKK